MPTPKRGPRLAGGPAQQKALLRNQATELFRHGRIRTTEAKAKHLRPYAEKLITKARSGDLHKRRQVLSELRDRDVVAYLFEDIAPRFVDRPGGYTRIVKLPPRQGDNSRMAIIELVDRGLAGSGEEAIEESKGRRSRGLFGRRRRRRNEPEGGIDALLEDISEDELSEEDDLDLDEVSEDEPVDEVDLDDEASGDDGADEVSEDDEVAEAPSEDSEPSSESSESEESED